METFQIAHLSDTHIRREYDAGGVMGRIFSGIENPAEGLKTALGQINAAGADAIVLTGDLVHEGESGDYRFLKEILERFAPGIPVLPVLGNHDLKREFYRGWLGEENDAPYYY